MNEKCQNCQHNGGYTTGQVGYAVAKKVPVNFSEIWCKRLLISGYQKGYMNKYKGCNQFKSKYVWRISKLNLEYCRTLGKLLSTEQKPKAASRPKLIFGAT